MGSIPGNLLSDNAESMETDASAWTGLVNVGLLSRGGPGTLGPNALSVRSTATGDMQVGLTTRVAVTAGQMYLCFASIFTPVASAQSRVEIRWYTSGGTLISTVQGPLVTPATVSWGQVGAQGVAPATAATATVVLRVGATAASQSWFADRVFLGPMPAVTTGNLLDFPTQDAEVDASGWTVPVNGAVTLTTSAAYWYQALRLTAAAAGEVQLHTVARPAVTAGAEYVAYVYVNPTTAALTTAVDIWWYDGAGGLLSTSSASWTPATAAWTRCVVVATAPSTAASARLVVRPTATAGGQAWTVDRAVLAPTSVVGMPGNLLPYDAADFEQTVSAWVGTACTVSQSSTHVLSGAYAARLVADGTGDMLMTLVDPVPVTGGLGYQFVPRVRRPEGSTLVYRTYMEWLAADGTILRSRWQTWGGISGSYVSGSMGDLAPDDATHLRVAVAVPGAPADETWYVDQVFVGLGGLTVRATPAGSSGVALTVRGLSLGGPTWKWSLTRIVGGQPMQPVRGWLGDLTNQPTTGDVYVITDHEAPVGVPVQWRVITAAPVASDGLMSYTTEPVTIEAPTLAVWLTDVSLPVRTVSAVVGTPLPDWSRQARQGVYQVRGRMRPIVLSDVRAGRTGQLILTTETEDERDAMWWALETGRTLLLKWPPGWGEQDAYVQVGDVTEAHITQNADHHDRQWTLALTEVDRPIGGVVGDPDRTWQTVANSGATWTDALAGATSWLDVYTGVTNS